MIIGANPHHGIHFLQQSEHIPAALAKAGKLKVYGAVDDLHKGEVLLLKDGQ